MSNFYTLTAPLYKAFISKTDNCKVPSDFKEIVKAVADKIGWQLNIETYDESINVQPIPENKKVMIGFSSGLDSAYLMHKLIDEGYEVTLCHIKGLNKSSAFQEEKMAKEIARANNLKLIIVPFSAPKQVFADNPFKNQLILSIMLNEGIKLGIYRYALGSDWTTPLSEGVTGFSITDTIEVNEAYWNAVKKYFNQAELLFIDNNDKKVKRVSYLYQNHYTTFKLISSCVAPHRFNEYWHKQNEQKYNIKLTKGRCGACYKCCMEYLLLCEQELVEKNNAYYDHCWDILANSKTSHRPDLFALKLPLEERKRNLLNYGS